MYAVIETGSKQYRVEVGTELHVELLDAEPGQTVTLERVLLVADGDTAAIGQPVVDGATVSAEVLRRDRGEKVIAFKYRPKARRRVKKGHRQELTVLRVADIVFGGKSAAEAVRKAEAAAKTERQRLEEAAARQAAEDAALAAKLAKTTERASGRAAGRAEQPKAEPSRRTKKTDTEAAKPKPRAGESASTAGERPSGEGSTARRASTSKTSGTSSPAPKATPRTPRPRKDD